MGRLALRKKASIRGCLVAACALLASGSAMGQDAEITVPAPNGAGTEIWVDMNPAGNTATSVDSIQRCRRVDTANTIFDVDVVVFNADSFQKMLLFLAFDSAYVQVLDVDQNYLIFSQGGQECNPTPWEIVDGNVVKIYSWTTTPGGGAGTGVLARITFEAKAPFGQSGFDVIDNLVYPTDLTPGGGGDCFFMEWNPELAVDTSPAAGQAYIDTTGTVGCWVVTSTGDLPDGTPGDGICDVDPAPGIVQCTLRAAIQEANATTGANHVSFRIPDESGTCGPPCTIACPNLPPLSDASGGTTLDGTTHPAVVLDAFGGSTDAIRIVSDNNAVKNLTIQRAFASGVRVNLANNNRILGCNIGTDHTGTAAARNDANGIEIVNGSNNEIGGQGAGEGNLIAAHSLGAGIKITGGTGNVIWGNTIGLDALGARMPNAHGVVLWSSNSNTIGGTVAAARNVISGNGIDGILLTLGSANNLIQGNYIGTDPTGTSNRFNGSAGIELDDAANTQIGGATVAAGTPPGNVVSTNSTFGIDIHSPTSTGNQVRGNLIGLGVDGSFLPNLWDGVFIDGANNNTIGGSDADDTNVISGNGHAGVAIVGGASGSQVQGNIIGMDATGLLQRQNGWHGVVIWDSPDNAVGGATAEPGTPPGNLISGNTQEGVYIGATAGQGGNTVSGNVIGLDANGFAAGNGVRGVLIWGSPNTVIGGATDNGRNVISGNGAHGVHLYGADAAVLRYNWVGPSTDGLAPRGNGLDAVKVEPGPPPTSMEGEAGRPIPPDPEETLESLRTPALKVETPTLPAAPCVVVIEDMWFGFGPLVLLGNNACVRRCKIGTNRTGTLPWGNPGVGVFLGPAAADNEIGSPGNGNLISGNGGAGVEIQGDGNLVRSNLIGLDVSGSFAIPNATGVHIRLGAQLNWVGGAILGEGNVISGNTGAGVLIENVDTDQNRVQRNIIGADMGRTQTVANVGSGVVIRNGAQFNVIADNSIEGNNAHGVWILGDGVLGMASRNEINDNFIGSISIPNAQNGIQIGPDATLNQVTRNTIGNNTIDGIGIGGPNADGNIVTGNAVLGNGGSGVRVAGGANDNVVGGFIPEARNRIQGNAGDGVTIVSGTGNGLYENVITLNGGLGIDLTNDGVTPNDGAPDGDGGANNLQNYPVLTSATSVGGATTVVGTLTSAPNTVYRVEFFSGAACDPSGFGEGDSFIGVVFVTTDATGTAAINSVLSGAAVGDLITATATDNTLYDTSEFSACVPVVGTVGAPTNLAIRTTPVVRPSAVVFAATAYDTAVVADTLVYNLTATNEGSSEATGVAVLDTLPDGVAFVSSGSSQGTCTGTEIVACDVGSMAADDTVMITIVVVPNVPGTLVNVATIHGNEADPDTTNNVARDTTVVISLPTGVRHTPRPVAEGLWLGQNIPNPFNPSTQIPFSLPGSANARLAIYDVTGRLVRVLLDEARPRGLQEVTWDGRDYKSNIVSTGIYFYVLETQWGKETRRMILLK